MLLEIIAIRPEDALAAKRGGADRIELVSGMLEGGLTPSIGMVETVVGLVDIPVNVMIRPHSQGFHYDRMELDAMRQDIRQIRRTGAAGIVLGVLTQDMEIDTSALQQLLDEAEHLDVTFHRAFDEVPNQLKALGILAGYPAISRILTSGGKPSALAAMPELAELVRASAGTSLRILAGSGLAANSLSDFIWQTGVPEVHFGSAVREGTHPLGLVIPEKVAELQRILKEAGPIEAGRTAERRGSK